MTATVESSQPTPAATTSRGRAQWVDVAKGAAIALVVLRHTQDALTGAQLGNPAWALVSDALVAVRMPLFFLVSGLFAARSIVGPWPRFARGKLAHYGWLFALWGGLYVAGYAAWAAATRQPEGAVWWAGHAAAMDSTPWYLLALAVFFGLARVFRRVPAAVQVAVAAACTVMFGLGLFSTGVWMFDRMGHYLLFFVVGVHYSSRVRGLVVRARWWHAAALTGLWLTVGAALVVLVPRGGNVGATLLPFVALPAALAVLGVVGNQVWLSPVAALGRRTLPVYVLHFAVVVAAVAVVGRLGGPGWVTWVWPLLLTVVVVAVCLPAGQVMERVAPWLLELPRRRRPVVDVGYDWAPTTVPSVSEALSPDLILSRPELSTHSE